MHPMEGWLPQVCRPEIIIPDHRHYHQGVVIHGLVPRALTQTRWDLSAHTMGALEAAAARVDLRVPCPMLPKPCSYVSFSSPLHELVLSNGSLCSLNAFFYLG